MKCRLISVLLLAALACAQTAVEITQEPHSSLLFQNSQVRVFRMSLNAHDQTYVIPRHNFLAVTLDNCDLAMWREGNSPNQGYQFQAGSGRFYFQGSAIGTRNNQTSPCRRVIVEFLDPRVTTYGYQWWDNGNWDYGVSGMPTPVDPHAKFANFMRLGSALAIDVQLLPGDSFSPSQGTSDELLIPVTSMELQPANQPRIVEPAGEVVWRTAGQRTELVNAGNAPARFVIVEFLGT